MAELLNEFLCDFQTQFSRVLSLTDDSDSRLRICRFVLIVFNILVGHTARQEAVLVRSDPPLIQHQPRHKPRALQKEDAAEADGGEDTEGLEAGHVLKEDNNL